MKNFGIKLNLALLKNIKFTRLDKQKCIIIPLKDNYIFEGVKGVYLQLVARELQNPQYEQTHMITLNIPEDVYKTLSEAERKHTPILGNVTPIITKQFTDDKQFVVINEQENDQTANPSNPPIQTPVLEQEDDLPF